MAKRHIFLDRAMPGRAPSRPWPAPAFDDAELERFLNTTRWVDINPERMPKPESMFEVKAKVIRDDEGDIFATLYCHPRRGYVVIAERSGRILTLARIGDELEG
jgi:hypothetical protein